MQSWKQARGAAYGAEARMLSDTILSSRPKPERKRRNHLSSRPKPERKRRRVEGPDVPLFVDITLAAPRNLSIPHNALFPHKLLSPLKKYFPKLCPNLPSQSAIIEL